MMLLQLCLVTGLITTHYFASNLKFLDVLPRSRWLSAAGGISVAYVFVHIFPELEVAQNEIQAHTPFLLFLEHHAYLLALLGLSAFYGLESFVTSSQRQQAKPQDTQETTTSVKIFWLHIASFALYNGLIGYLIVHGEEQRPAEQCLFFVAMAVHFVVNDYALCQDHRSLYRRVGRWILVGAIATGWSIGFALPANPAWSSILFAFLSGGIVLNVLKEELPEGQQSQFWPFITGASIYTVLLLFV